MRKVKVKGPLTIALRKKKKKEYNLLFLSFFVNQRGFPPMTRNMKEVSNRRLNSRTLSRSLKSRVYISVQETYKAY